MLHARPIAHPRSRITHALVHAVLVLAAVAALRHPAGAAGIDLVRMEGVLGQQNAPGSVAQLTLAVGKKSIPLSVSSAQRISGAPASAPEIFSALGPGPPPIRVEGRDGMTKKLADAPAGTRVTIIGNLDVATPYLTLLDVVVAKSAGAQ
jgi:hypothetical protein